jgi:Mg2+/Co2+ transporter CorB
MEVVTLVTLAAILVLLVTSAFFSGSETSLTAASLARMHTLEQQGERRATVVNDLLRRKESLIGAILFGNNLVNIMASALATSLLIGWFGEAGVVYATIGMTFLVLVFAEVLPKTYAIHNADDVALAVAPVLRPIVVLLRPITIAVSAVVRGTLWLFSIRSEPTLTASQSEEELRGAIDLHSGKDGEVRHERAMLRSILDLADVEVGEIMTHRRNVVAIDVGLPQDKIIEEVLESPYTRLPLWRDDPDNFVGVLHAKALLRAIRAQDGQARDRQAQDSEDRDSEDRDTEAEPLDLVEIANPPWFIPESTDLLSQLEAFRGRHEHFAIVVDEYGEVLGIVTLEDILEEIVGEIEDEHDVEVEGVKLLVDGSMVVDGDVTLRDLNRMYEWRLPDEEASTVAGLVLHEARRIPEVGQVFAFHGFRFQILKRQRNQITSIMIKPLGELPDPAEAEGPQDST